MEQYQGGTPAPRAERGPSAGVFAVIALLFGLVGGMVGFAVLYAGEATGRLDIGRALGLPPAAVAPAPPAAPAPPGVPSRAAAASLPDFAGVADRVNSSVVFILTEARRENPYDFFFGGGPEVVRGQGAGIIVDTDGHIITNNHVVDGARNITVTVLSGDGSQQQYPAELVGKDATEDLAVIKVKAGGLVPAPLGDSDALQVGQWVMAIGNPFGFEHTVSVGVVSALNRHLPVEDGRLMRGLVQTDASINPGNSGGPLVNLAGEVVGINTAIYVGGGSGPQASGLGFAIPSTRVKQVFAALKAGKQVSHPWLGIKYVSIDDKLRKESHLPVKQGAVVQNIMADSPADKAGLHEQDVITAIDGKPLVQQTSLSDYVAKKASGDVVTLSVLRDVDGRWDSRQIKVKLEDMPAKPEENAQPEESTPKPERKPLLPFPWPF